MSQSATHAPAKPGLFRRLDTAHRRRRLTQKQRKLRSQLASTQQDLDEATREAIALARLHRRNPALQVLRQGLRAERECLEHELQAVGMELAELPTQGRNRLLLLATAGLAALFTSSCGGGGSQDEEPQPRPPLDCAKTPEQCK